MLNLSVWDRTGGGTGVCSTGLIKVTDSAINVEKSSFTLMLRDKIALDAQKTKQTKKHKSAMHQITALFLVLPLLIWAHIKTFLEPQ